MIKVNRSVRIEWRNNPSSFELRNKKAFRTDFLRLGSAVRPVNELLSRSEELRVLLPTVIGISPIDSSWQERVTTYLNDFHLEIPTRGLTFDTSYVLDLGNPTLKANLDELINTIKDAPKVKSELEQVVLKKIKSLDETELYKYVTFVNIPDYISWRYCLLSSAVANKIEDIDKSVKIQFYLTSDDERKAAKAAKTKRMKDALTYYTKLVNGGESEMVENVVIISGRINSYAEIKNLTDDERDTILLDLCNEDPDKFIALVTDKHVQSKAKIIKWEWMGLIRKLPNSTIYVDANDPEKIIGNNLNDTVSFLANDLNKGYISEIEAKYRSLK